MTEVLEGEIVEPDESRKFSSITPAKQKIVLEKILDGSTMSAAARHARIAPRTLIRALDAAVESPRHKLHKFALDVGQALAEREDDLRKEMLDLGRKKGLIEPIRIALERQFRESWTPPQDKRQQPVIAISISDRLAQLSGPESQSALPTGD